MGARLRKVTVAIIAKSGRLFKGLMEYRRLLVGIAAGLGILAASLALTNQFGPRATYGQIFVGSPEIYTRERLVNDRFVQQAWLKAQLPDASVKSHSGPVAPVTSDRQERQMQGEIHLPAPTAANSSTGSTDARRAPESVRQPPASTAAGSMQDWRARTEETVGWSHMLAAEVDYRDYVRDLLIENELDDRHDLNGNSLYKMKFDATIVPGVNTRATAQVTIQIAPHRNPRSERKAPAAFYPKVKAYEDLRKWRDTYHRWISSLEYRLNQTSTELRQAYEENKLTRDDYARLIRFVAQSPGMSPDALRSLPPCRQFVEFERQNQRLPPLASSQHKARKECLEKLVRNSAGVGNPSALLGQYPKEKNWPAPVRVLSKALLLDSDKRASTDLNQLLNKFFAPKAIQLVLGISIPQGSFVEDVGTYSIVRIAELRSLVELAILDRNFWSTDGKVFTVSPRTWTIRAFDSNQTMISNVLELAREREEFAEVSLDEFRTKFENLQAYDRDVQVVASANYPISSEDFSQLGGNGPLFLAEAELGLRTFINQATAQSSTYIYAATPKVRAEFVYVERSGSRRTDSAGTLGSGTAGLSTMSKNEQQALAVRGLVVGFKGPSPDTETAGVGWVILPGFPGDAGNSPGHIHTAAQYSLSALVSLPAWWSEVDLNVTTAWLDSKGMPIQKLSTTRYETITLPSDFETFEASLFTRHAVRPEVMGSDLDSIDLTACSPGAILIPGRRLWRSSVVTLGYQPADRIEVLPNMKGIIARFSEVWNQADLTENPSRTKQEIQPIERTVRVWTSQGAIALPRKALISIPNDCAIGGQNPTRLSLSELPQTKPKDNPQ